MRPELRTGLVVNGRTRTAIGAGTRSALEQVGYPVLRTELGRRVAHPEAMAAGLGVTSYQPGSVAALEVRNLVDDVESFVMGVANVA